MTHDSGGRDWDSIDPTDHSVGHPFSNVRGDVGIGKQQVFGWWKSHTGLCTTWHEAWRKTGEAFITRIQNPEDANVDHLYQDSGTNEMHRDAVRYAESCGYTADTFKPVSSCAEEVFEIFLQNFLAFAKYGHVQGPCPNNRTYQRFAVHKILVPGENPKSHYLYPGKGQSGNLVPDHEWCNEERIGAWVLTFRCGISWPHQIELKNGVRIAEVYEDLFDKLPRSWAWQPGMCPENPQDIQLD